METPTAAITVLFVEDSLPVRARLMEMLDDIKVVIVVGKAGTPGRRHGGGRLLRQKHREMHGNMGDWHWGFGAGHWVFGALFWAVVILIIATLITNLIKK